MLVCKQWALIASEFLFRTITLREPSRLHILRKLLEDKPDVARKIRQLYIYEEDRVHKTAISDYCVQNQLIPIISRCNRLQVFSIEQYVLKNTSAHLVAALETSCKQTLTSLNLRIAHMAEVVFDGHDRTSPKSSVLSSAYYSTSTPVFPKLTNLGIRGMCSDLVGHTMTWTKPQLTTLMIDFEICRINNESGVSTILGGIGDQLKALDIHATDVYFDFNHILDLCPNLEAVFFDLGHWKTAPSNKTTTPKLAQYPSLKTVGLHGLRQFLGLDSWGYGETSTTALQFSNIGLLLDKKHFPNLRTVRVLDTGVASVVTVKSSDEVVHPLTAMIRDRWQALEKQFKKQAVCLEDCTGRRLDSHHPLIQEVPSPQ